MDLRALELVYKNCESSEELEIALKFHGISEETLFELATEHGWVSKPITIKSLPLHPELEEVDAEHIDATNKASIRRLNSILELAITKFSYSINPQNTGEEELSMGVVVDQLERLVKTREKLTKLEMPLYGLTTSEPLVISNPYNVYFDDKEDIYNVEEEKLTEDGKVEGADNETEDEFI